MKNQPTQYPSFNTMKKKLKLFGKSTETTPPFDRALQRGGNSIRSSAIICFKKKRFLLTFRETDLPASAQFVNSRAEGNSQPERILPTSGQDSRASEVSFVRTYGDTAIVTGLLCFPPMVSTTGISGEGRVPGGIRTLI